MIIYELIENNVIKLTLIKIANCVILKIYTYLSIISFFKNE